MMPVEVAQNPAGAAVTGGRWGGVPGWLRSPAWRPVLRSWVAARVVVLLALLAAQLLHRHDHDLRTEGLLGWDADWYHLIASHGYGALPQEALRFFPLLPLLARGLSYLLLGSEGAALLVLGNGGAIAFGLLLHRLVVREGLGTRVADRAVWVSAFVPAGFVQVMGYTEPLYGALVCGMLLAARSRRWWVVALLGLLAGALRPPAVVLGAVVLTEALVGLRAARPRERLARAVAVVAPAGGLAAYLLWVGVRFGDPLLPFRVQVGPDLRGGTFVNPLTGLVGSVEGLFRWRLMGAGLHPLWLVVAVGLLVVAFRRRLPPSYLVLGMVTVLLGVTARSMTSFERYAGSTPTLLIAAALLTVPNRLRAPILVIAPVLLAAYAVMAFLHLYVP